MRKTGNLAQNPGFSGPKSDRGFRPRKLDFRARAASFRTQTPENRTAVGLSRTSSVFDSWGNVLSVPAVSASWHTHGGPRPSPSGKAGTTLVPMPGTMSTNSAAEQLPRASRPPQPSLMVTRPCHLASCWSGTARPAGPLCWSDWDSPRCANRTGLESARQLPWP